MKKKITSYEIIDHGVEHSQYFQGCGVSYTEYTFCVTGIGNSAREALDDCLEQLAMDDYDIPADLATEASNADDTDEVYRVIESDAPALTWTVRLSPYCGSMDWQETFDSEDDARAFVAERLSKFRQKYGPFHTLERGHKWELLEPDNVAMVPDACGVLSMESNEEERQNWLETAMDGSELRYLVSVRVSTGNEE